MSLYAIALASAGFALIRSALAAFGGGLARRRIGQERLRIGESHVAVTALDEIVALIDWTAIGRHLVRIYPATKGEQGWPPLVLPRHAAGGLA